MSPEQLSNNISEIIEGATSAFNEGLEKSQKTAYSKISSAVKDLSLDQRGNIKKTAGNIKVLKGLTKSLNESLVTATYKARVGTFVRAYDSIAKEQLAYFRAIESGYQASAMLQVIKADAVDVAVQALTESGLETYFTQPVKQIIVNNISTGGSYSAFQEELREYILGTDEVEGRYLSYTKQITNDSINNYNATYNNTVSEDLGLEFYKYTGSAKDTTRDFCMERKNKFYHIEEIRAWGKGEKCCGLSLPSTKDGKAYWPGMRKGTNENTILINRGGYMCGHQFIAVSQAIVPDDVIKRAKDKGLI